MCIIVPLPIGVKAHFPTIGNDCGIEINNLLAMASSMIHLKL
jgi:hypothetical protein